MAGRATSRCGLKRETASKMARGQKTGRRSGARKAITEASGTKTQPPASPNLIRNGVLGGVQLHIMTYLVVGDRCRGLMSSSPERPSHVEVERDGGFRQFRHDPLEFAERRDEGPQTAKHSVGLRSVGLVSFGLAAALRHCAVSLARNAAAAMTRVIWRCHPCQERASQ